MNCPYCNFHFKVLAVMNATELPPLAPVVCEDCAEVSLLENGKIRKLTDIEMKAVEASPAWKTLQPAIRIIQSAIKARKAHTN